MCVRNYVMYGIYLIADGLKAMRSTNLRSELLRQKNGERLISKSMQLPAIYYDFDLCPPLFT